jgi:hypothetical protein
MKEVAEHYVGLETLPSLLNRPSDGLPVHHSVVCSQNLGKIEIDGMMYALSVYILRTCFMPLCPGDGSYDLHFVALAQ